MPTQRLEEKRVKAHVGEGEREGGRESKRRREIERVHACGRERERERTLAPPFICFFFSSTWACPMQIGLSQECCLFYLKSSSLWSSDLPLTFLCSIFAGFSLPCLLAIAILDSFSLIYLPNKIETPGRLRQVSLLGPLDWSCIPKDSSVTSAG